MYITYIDEEEIAREQEKMKRNKAIVDEEERSRREIEKQKARAAKVEKQLGLSKPSESTALLRDDPNQKITFSLGIKSETKEKKTMNIFDSDDEDADSNSPNLTGKKRKLEETKNEEPEEEPPKKKKQTILPYWLHEGIIVKVILKDLGKGKYYKKKGF